MCNPTPSVAAGAVIATDRRPIRRLPWNCKGTGDADNPDRGRARRGMHDQCAEHGARRQAAMRCTHAMRAPVSKPHCLGGCGSLPHRHRPLTGGASSEPLRRARGASAALVLRSLASGPGALPVTSARSQHDLPHRPAADALDAGEQFHPPCPAATAVMAHPIEDDADRQVTVRGVRTRSASDPCRSGRR